MDEFDTAPAPKPPGRGLTEYVLRSGKPLLASPEVFTRLRELGEVDDIGAPSIDWLGVPLVVDGEPIGVMVVQTYTEGVRYGEEDKNILKFVCDQISMAVHRKKSEEELQKRERFLASVFESIQDGLAILDRECRFIRVNPTIEKWYAHALPLVGEKMQSGLSFPGRDVRQLPDAGDAARRPGRLRGHPARRPRRRDHGLARPLQLPSHRPRDRRDAGRDRIPPRHHRTQGGRGPAPGVAQREGGAAAGGPSPGQEQHAGHLVAPQPAVAPRPGPRRPGDVPGVPAAHPVHGPHP